MARPERGRRGSALLEFTLLGIPMILLFTSVVSCSLDMWQFFTLSYATEMTSRYAGMHGATCTQGTNACTVSVATVASYFSQQSIALDTSKTTLILTDTGGSTTCNPVTACSSSSATFPSAGHNAVGADLTVKATYTLTNPIAMLWPGSSGVSAGTFIVGATSTQRISF